MRPRGPEDRRMPIAHSDRHPAIHAHLTIPRATSPTSDEGGDSHRPQSPRAPMNVAVEGEGLVRPR